MSRLLPLTDFRARPRVLTRRDFGYAPRPAPRPSDIIDEATWDTIVTLPDDVAVRTSNYHGTTLKQLDELWGAWIECVGEKQDSMFPVMLDAGDDFQASSTYNTLTGFYRLSVAALRSALELTTIGAWAQICGKQKEFRSWRSGKFPLSFGQACDGLCGSTSALRDHLRATVNDSLFDQKNSSDGGGFARRIFSRLSKFSHSRPGYSDSDMRKSNGPIYTLIKSTCHVRRLRNNIRIMRNTSLALNSLFPSVRQGVLAATLSQPEKWWYLSELAEFLHTRPSSLQRELISLEQSGILQQRKDGRRTYFKAETRSPIFRELRGIFEKTVGLIPTLTATLQPFANKIVCAFVYGSIARRQEHATSDVDLMVIGNVGLGDLAPSLRKAEKRLGREINVTNYSVDEFRKKVSEGDHFLTSVLKGSLQLVKGEQRDLDAVAGK